MTKPTYAFFQANCNGTSVGFAPLLDLGTGLYLGQFQGGHYPDGANTPPPGHAAEGIARANEIQPLDAFGNASANGKIVLLSIGMSNTTQEFCSQPGSEPCDAWTFMGEAAAHPDVNQKTLVIANGARGGQTAGTWDSPNDANYERVRTEVLQPKGLTEAQVQVAWVKVANGGPMISLPNENADAYRLLQGLGNIARTLKVRYPNIKIMFVSNRIYAGYASTPLNPEPYAYESGFASKWVIEAQIEQMSGGPVHPIAGDLDYGTVAPWIAWGPDLWADGLNARSDGLTWLCTDMQSDGTHPAQPAEQKVGTMLLDFMLTSAFASPWFRASGPPIVPVLSLPGIGAATLSLVLAFVSVVRKHGR